MKLDYDMVAIDDDADSASTYRDAAGGFLYDEGFALRWTTLSSPDVVSAYLAERSNVSPDLVVVDNKLGEEFDGNDGDHWARKLRSRFRSTEIVFYGADSADQLRNKIALARVDGVFCSTRADLSSLLRDIIGLHIRRWTDPGAMRGLAVGIAAEMDDLLVRICTAVAVAQEGPIRQRFYDRIRRKLTEKAGSDAKAHERHIAADSVESLFQHASFGAALLAASIRYLAEVVPKADAVRAKQLMERYTSAVIEKRNVLAHGKYDPHAGVFRLGGRVFERSVENCREFRLSLALYARTLRKIAEKAEASGELDVTHLE